MKDIVMSWGDVLSLSFKGLWLNFISFVPNLVFALVVFIVGWVIAHWVKKAISHLAEITKFNKLFQGGDLEATVVRAGFKMDMGHFIGEIARWFILIWFLTASLSKLGLDEVNVVLVSVVKYLPHVIVAAFVLLLASYLSAGVRKLISGSARAAHVQSAGMLGTVAYYAVWVFAFLICFYELGVARDFMTSLFAGIVGMFAIGGGIALGLGGKDAVARGIEKMRDDMNS